MKNVVIISDLHCGSLYGLTPPKHWVSAHKYREIQRDGWNSYKQIVHNWKHPDILIVNGDCIDGHQSRSGGAELITNDMNTQAYMAEMCLREFDAKQIFMTFGTEYHTSSGGAEDFEHNIARQLGATIEGKLKLNIDGMTFDIRHKVGGSGIPHGRATSLLRESMWNLVESSLGQDSRADCIIRSHIHYFIWVEQSNRVCFTTPCLQVSRGRYGSRQCTGETNWGAIRLRIKGGQIVGRDINICNLRSNSQRVIKIK